MGQRKINFAIGEYYHLYNRGNSKQIIFHDDIDYRRFHSVLFVANATNRFVFREAKKMDVYDFERGEQLVAIEAYCLMPNHFHILLTPLQDDGVQRFMQKLATSYSMYFNQRHDRTGGLFEGRFKSQYIDSDEYLKYLFSYIHLNPLKLIQSDWKEVGLYNIPEAVSLLKKYEYSSLVDYLRLRNREAKDILTTTIAHDIFETQDDWLKEMSDWLQLEQFLLA